MWQQSLKKMMPPSLVAINCQWLLREGWGFWSLSLFHEGMLKALYRQSQLCELCVQWVCQTQEIALFPLSVSSSHLPCSSSHLGMGDTDVLHSAHHSTLICSENLTRCALIITPATKNSLAKIESNNCQWLWIFKGSLTTHLFSKTALLGSSLGLLTPKAWTFGYV